MREDVLIPARGLADSCERVRSLQAGEAAGLARGQGIWAGRGREVSERRGNCVPGGRGMFLQRALRLRARETTRRAVSGNIWPKVARRVRDCPTMFARRLPAGCVLVRRCLAEGCPPGAGLSVREWAVFAGYSSSIASPARASSRWRSGGWCAAFRGRDG